MVNIIKQEVVIEESLKKKLELTCEFSNTTLKIINGSIRKIDRTNLTYVEPHRIIINDITFLAFNYSNEIFIESLSNKIKLSELEDNKQSINKQITKLNKDKSDITDEINQKKRINNKIVLKSKNKMHDEINKLTEENIHLRFENKHIKEKYEQLEEKTNYLIYHLNKVFEKLPEFIQKIVEKLFNNKVLSLFSFKHDYDPEERKTNQEYIRKHNIFNKREIEKATKHINDEMEESAENFYVDKKYKEKDDGLSL